MLLNSWGFESSSISSKHSDQGFHNPRILNFPQGTCDN